jgi:hypothetical protein
MATNINININTKTFPEIQSAFAKVISRHGVTVSKGIVGGRVGLEDGLPWVEVDGVFTRETAHAFLQELADGLNVRVLFNRLDIHGMDEVATLHGVLDFDPARIHAPGPVPAYTTTPAAFDFMAAYGDEILPRSLPIARDLPPPLYL